MCIKNVPILYEKKKETNEYRKGRKEKQRKPMKTKKETKETKENILKKSAKVWDL